MRTGLKLFASVALSTAMGGADAVEAPRATEAPVIDGGPGDAAWSQSDWHEIEHVIIGDPPADDDFSGRYKVVWTPEYIYVLAEIVDDVLIDSHPDPLKLHIWRFRALLAAAKTRARW